MARQVSSPIRTILDEQFAEFIGIFLGDGSLFIRENKCDYDFKIVGNPYDEKPYYEYVARLLSRILNREIVPRMHDKGRSYGIRFCSKRLAKRISNLNVVITNKSHTARIPNFILRDSDLTRACLRGLFDTDGCLTIKKDYYPVITFVTASFILATQISNELFKIGIRHSASYNMFRYDERTRTVSVRNEVSINGFTNVRLFYAKIGSNNPKMIEKYKERVEVAGSGFEPPIFAQKEISLASSG